MSLDERALERFRGFLYRVNKSIYKEVIFMKKLEKNRQTDEGYMHRAIEIAYRGEGWAHPNPLVGAVIVKNNKIIGEGAHIKCGELHAERNAIASAKESLEGSTIYVTLEPCCHYGKTPPCTEAIIESKIARVVIGSRDPNPKVSGKGVKILRAAGIEVITDFLRDECDALNDIFFHYISTATPYVIMKYAMTSDGKIATKSGKSKWITGRVARERVQELRHRCMGIMVGIGTVLTDDPMLNCRADNIDNIRHPIRIICDSKLRIPIDSRIASTASEYETIVVISDNALNKGEIRVNEANFSDTDTAEKATILMSKGVKIINSPGENGRVDLRNLMSVLGEMRIDSILLEGGGTLNESALEADIVNEIEAYIAPKIFGGMGKAPVCGSGVDDPSEAVMLSVNSIEQIGEDILIKYKVNRKGERCSQE